MLKSLINQSSRCLNKLNFLPKQLSIISSKSHSTVSNSHDFDGYKSIFLNYSTSVSYPKAYVQKLIDIQRSEKISPYMFFIKDQLKSNNYNGVAPTKRIKDLGEKWTSMSELDKKRYIDLAEKNREQLSEERKKLLSTLNEDEISKLTNDVKREKIERYKKLKETRIKKEKIKQKAPKRPKGAFFLYCDTLDRGEAHVKDFTRGAAAKWNLMAEQDKQKFFNLANELMERYKNDYSEWEAKMVEKGKKNLLRKKTVEAIDLKRSKKSKKKTIKSMRKILN